MRGMPNARRSNDGRWCGLDRYDQLWSRKKHPSFIIFQTIKARRQNFSLSLICQAIKARHPSKAPANPPRLAETKHQRLSSSRRRPRHMSPLSFEGSTVASNMSGDSGRLTTPAPSVARSRSRSRSREHHHSRHRKSGHGSRRHSPGLTSPTPSHASGRRQDSLTDAPKLTPALAGKRPWGPFRTSDGCSVRVPASFNTSNLRAASPEPMPVSPYTATMPMPSDAGGVHEGRCGCCSRPCGTSCASMPPVQILCCLGSRRIKRAWRVTPREMMTGGVGDSIAIGLRLRHLQR